MFVQVIQGQVSSADDLRRASDRWEADLRPAAAGFLGSTGGVTADGEAVLVARFEDKAAAEANSNRPEQGAWWDETEKIFDGEPTFADSEDVDLQFGGGSDKAGFVQVMEGLVLDRDGLRTFEAEWNDRLHEGRPDMLGSVRIWHDAGRFTELAYFTSEADARAGEANMPDTLTEAIGTYSLLVNVDRYLDLSDPIIN